MTVRISSPGRVLYGLAMVAFGSVMHYIAGGVLDLTWGTFIGIGVTNVVNGWMG